MKRYLARLCWNDHGWEVPSGNTNERGTYADTAGFGCEEWLFNDWQLGDWNYGFLRPIARSFTKVSGQRLGVYLYTVAPGSEWFRVGHIEPCEVLTREEIQWVRREYEQRRWHRVMKEQVKAIGGDVEQFAEDWRAGFFNIRFRSHDARRYKQLVPVGDGESLRAQRRYNLVALTPERASIESEWRERVGVSALTIPEINRRQAVPEVAISWRHRTLQQDLYRALAEQFGASSVTMEEGWVDVKLTQGGRVTLFEIKTDSNPTSAIREAIGQLLAYAHRSKGEAVTLVVVAPGVLAESDRVFLEFVRATLRLPIGYLTWRPGMKSRDLPAAFA